MESIIVQPKNKEELIFVTEFLKRTNIKSSLSKANNTITRKKASRKEEILDGIARGYEQAVLHSEGKMKLKTLEEFLHEL